MGDEDLERGRAFGLGGRALPEDAFNKERAAFIEVARGMTDPDEATVKRVGKN